MSIVSTHTNGWGLLVRLGSEEHLLGRYETGDYTTAVFKTRKAARAYIKNCSSLSISGNRPIPVQVRVDVTTV